MAIYGERMIMTDNLFHVLWLIDPIFFLSPPPIQTIFFFFATISGYTHTVDDATSWLANAWCWTQVEPADERRWREMAARRSSSPRWVLMVEERRDPTDTPFAGLFETDPIKKRDSAPKDARQAPPFLTSLPKKSSPVTIIKPFLFFNGSFFSNPINKTKKKHTIRWYANQPGRRHRFKGLPLYINTISAQLALLYILLYIFE